MAYLHCIFVSLSHDDVTIYARAHQTITLLYMFRFSRSFTVYERACQTKR